MAISSTYYLDAPSLGSASIIYSDAALTTVAADGYYSDGVISRQQVDGVLLPQQTCPSCECVGLFNLGNTSDDLDISGMTIGGASVVVTSGAFPSTPSSSNIIGEVAPSITLPDTVTLVLTSVTSGIANQKITVIDSNGATQTQVISIGTSNVTFTDVYIDCSIGIEIFALPVPVYYTYDISSTSSPDQPTACAYVGPTTTVYAAEPTAATVTNFYTNTLLTTYFSGDSFWYRYQLSGGGGSRSALVGLSGSVSSITTC